MTDFVNKILCGDSLEVLKTLPDRCVNMVMTSPPYYALRDYKIKGQIGLEKTPEEYLEKLWTIFDEVRRVLRDDGVIFVNLGDTYGGAALGVSYAARSKGPNSCIDNETLEATPESGHVRGKMDKCLLMIPERFAWGMIQRGWVLRNRICWSKPNPMPCSVKDRFTCTWEYIWFFSKKKHYFFNLDDIRVPITTATVNRYRYPINDMKGKFSGALSTEKAGNFQKCIMDRSTLTARPVDNFRNKTADQSYKIGGMRNCPEPNDPEYSKSKFLSGEQKTASPGARGLLTVLEGKLTTEVRKKLKGVGAYLKDKLKKSDWTVESLSEKLGIKNTTLAHYFRTDLSGQALPTRELWKDMKPLLDLGNYDDFISEEIRSALPQPHPLGKNPGDYWDITDRGNAQNILAARGLPATGIGPTGFDHNLLNHPLGKNPGDFWSITTKSFKEAHFAVYPEELCEKPIKAGCPEFICKKCGQIRTKILKKTTPNKYTEQGNPEGKDRSKMKWNDRQTGWSDCRCEAGFRPGIVLDPFAGTGTTCVVAKKLHRDYIGIELNPEYVKMAEKRLEYIEKSLF